MEVKDSSEYESEVDGSFVDIDGDDEQSSVFEDEDLDGLGTQIGTFDNEGACCSDRRFDDANGRNILKYSSPISSNAKSCSSEKEESLPPPKSPLTDSSSLDLSTKRKLEPGDDQSGMKSLDVSAMPKLSQTIALHKASQDLSSCLRDLKYHSCQLPDVVQHQVPPKRTNFFIEEILKPNFGTRLEMKKDLSALVPPTKFWSPFGDKWSKGSEYPSHTRAFSNNSNTVPQVKSYHRPSTKLFLNRGDHESSSRTEKRKCVESRFDSIAQPKNKQTKASMYSNGQYSDQNIAIFDRKTKASCVQATSCGERLRETQTELNNIKTSSRSPDQLNKKTNSFSPYPESSCSNPASSSPVVTSSSPTVMSGTGDTTPSNNETLWPAWVYCTRYSDRPSAGRKCPRSRKVTHSDSDQGDDKRPRTAFSSDQLDLLKAEFDENHYLTEDRRQSLAKKLNLHESQIKIWFQNKRAKMKKASGVRNKLALELMAQGLYNHSTVASVN